LQEVAEDVGQIEHDAARRGGSARDSSVESVEHVEEEVGVDLRLQRAQLGLADQAVHLLAAQGLHALFNFGGGLVKASRSAPR